MKNVSKITILLSLLILTSCGPKLFYSPDAYNLARNHQKIAIVPPKVSIEAHKKVDANAIKEQQKTESLNFQNEMYSWMLQRKTQGKLTTDIQDIETTNALLKKEGYPETILTPAEICSILGVDGIITSNFSMKKPMSQGAAIAIAVLFGAWGSTNEVAVSLNIKDCEQDKLIFNYDHKFSGSIGSSPTRLVDGLMRNASKKMPYIIKN